MTRDEVMRIRGVLAAMVGAAVIGTVLMVPSAQGAGSVRSSVSLSAPASGTYGTAASLTGTVWRTGTAAKLPGATVYLQRSLRGQNKFANLTSTRTGSTGTFAFSTTLAGFDYRVYYPGSATYMAAYSPVRQPATNRYVALDTMATTDAESGKLRAEGRIIPAPPNGTPVYLQRFSTDAGVWVNVASAGTAGTNVAINATRPGSAVQYRLTIGSLFPYGPGASTAKRFTHLVWRGAFTSYPLRNTGATAITADRSPTSTNEIRVFSGGGRITQRLSAEACVEAHLVTKTIKSAKAITQTLAAATQAETVSVGEGAEGVLKLSLSGSGIVDLITTTTDPDRTAFTLQHTLMLRCAN
ncbi:hypothetical protein [Kribbella deserti]|uniref:Carboxypeptidase regulatory-like domain-containing protein n=1 Tax=Kribbella deserti TaxID=1926257 RepID=A0ABV6QN51_9ACTN